MLANVGPATVSVGFLKLFLRNLANREVVWSNVTASQGKTEGLEGPLDEVERSNKVSERSWADVIGSVASLVDALACLTFLVLPATPASGARLCVLLLLDPITCVIGYWVMYRRLMIERPKLSELGFYLVISGTLFLVCQNVLEESAALNSSPRDYSNATEIDILLELLVTLTLPFGLAIYAWLIGRSPVLRRWLGFLIGIQVVLLFISLSSSIFPWLNDLVTSQPLNVYAIIVSLAKTAWFLWPVAGTKRAYR
jgi:hypothetical protein